MAEIKALEHEMNQPRFWNDRGHAEEISRKFNNLKEEVTTWEKLEQDAREILELALISEKEVNTPLKSEIETKAQELEKKFLEMEFVKLFAGQYDKNDAIISFHAGAGGVDAQDWAEMLLRMITRYCENKGFTVKIMHQSKGGEAGLKSATIEVSGRYAYGHLKSESGVHRLVRISPFDAEQMRHTSFALIEVLPELARLEKVKIKDEDLKIDTFRASGHGGQSVNTTDSAVRITHIPTGIGVVCQNERSQSQNKEFALKMLGSKLNKLLEEKNRAEKQKIRGEYASAEWGNQIRSYVLHPYKMVKDHRTKHEAKNPEEVLDGRLDGFIEAYLRYLQKK